jgi:alkylated DNA repair protein alkB family protein 4
VIKGCDEHKSQIGEEFEVGVFLSENFLSETEAKRVVEKIDSLMWDQSQSGRWKKNFGPKVNFKKKKLRVDEFMGFEECTESIREKLAHIDLLRDFVTVEECFLDYNVDRGSHIEPHIDDCWVIFKNNYHCNDS